MKKLTPLFTLLILTFSVVNATNLTANSINLKGNSNTSLGNYKIKELPPVNVNGEMIRSFELTYENAQKTVLIYLEERAKCRDYVVRSKNLEVRYECRKASFGVQILTDKQMKYNPALNNLFINQEEFEKQKRISEGSLPIDSALGLIASYYPNLLKSTNLLN